MAKRKIPFSLMAPAAEAVLLAGDFTNWEMDAILMKRQKTGIWKTTVSLESGRYEYRFLVDGQWRDDPASVEKVANRYGTENCVRTVE